MAPPGSGPPASAPSGSGLPASAPSGSAPPADAPSGSVRTGFDAAVGAASIAAEVAGDVVSRVAGGVVVVVSPVTRAGRPVARLIPGDVLGHLARRGRAEQQVAATRLMSLLDAVVPGTVDAVLDRVDLNGVVRHRVDLVGIADEVIEGIDLPEIIRKSTQGVATETVRDVRMQSIDADEAVSRLVDRLVPRRRRSARDQPARDQPVRGGLAGGPEPVTP
jgi:antitoxin (DNA-binding transcriptional repressor) of toxin-antitoxin stability system